MNAFAHVQRALGSFDFPCVPDLYRGSEKTYFVYNYSQDSARLHADDGPEEVVAGIQVHLFLPAAENFLKLKNIVRMALLKEGFTYSDITVMLDEDKTIRHIIFECEIEESEED